MSKELLDRGIDGDQARSSTCCPKASKRRARLTFEGERLRSSCSCSTSWRNAVHPRTARPQAWPALLAPDQGRQDAGLPRTARQSGALVLHPAESGRLPRASKWRRAGELMVADDEADQARNGHGEGDASAIRNCTRSGRSTAAWRSCGAFGLKPADLCRRCASPAASRRRASSWNTRRQAQCCPHLRVLVGRGPQARREWHQDHALQGAGRNGRRRALGYDARPGAVARCCKSIWRTR